MKILSTMRAGRVTRQSLYVPRDPNLIARRRALSIPKEEKLRANLKTSYEKLLMLVCANFEPGDWWVTVTYDNEHLPETRAESQPIFRRFTRSLRKDRKKNGEVLRYVYCTQLTTRGGGIRLHHHMIMRFEDESDRELIKKSWPFGKIIYIRKLKNYEDILEKARYMCREPRELGVHVPGEQMWTASRGLIRPKFEYQTIDNDAIDISVPVGCTELSEPLQMPGYGGYKTIIYYEPM